MGFPNIIAAILAHAIGTDIHARQAFTRPRRCHRRPHRLRGSVSFATAIATPAVGATARSIASPTSNTAKPSHVT